MHRPEHGLVTPTAVVGMCRLRPETVPTGLQAFQGCMEGPYRSAHAEHLRDGFAINDPLEVGHGAGVVHNGSSTCQAAGCNDFSLVPCAADEVL